MDCFNQNVKKDKYAYDHIYTVGISRAYNIIWVLENMTPHGTHWSRERNDETVSNITNMYPING